MGGPPTGPARPGVRAWPQPPRAHMWGQQLQANNQPYLTRRAWFYFTRAQARARGRRPTGPRSPTPTQVRLRAHGRHRKGGRDRTLGRNGRTEGGTAERRGRRGTTVCMLRGRWSGGPLEINCAARFVRAALSRGHGVCWPCVLAPHVVPYAGHVCLRRNVRWPCAGRM